MLLWGPVRVTSMLLDKTDRDIRQLVGLLLGITIGIPTAVMGAAELGVGQNQFVLLKIQIAPAVTVVIMAITTETSRMAGVSNGLILMMEVVGLMSRHQQTHRLYRLCVGSGIDITTAITVVRFLPDIGDVLGTQQQDGILGLICL